MRALRSLILAIALAASTSNVGAETAPTGYLLVSGWYKDRGVQREYMRGVTPILRARGYEKAVIAGTGYAPFAPDVVRAHGGEFLVRASQADTELLEGAHLPGSLIVVEFPDAEALRRFWSSDVYRRLSEIRKATGKWSVVELLPANGSAVP